MKPKKLPLEIEIEKRLDGIGSIKELETDYRRIEQTLDPIAEGIGWMVINFNSLEDQLTDEIRERLSDSPTMDEHILAIIQNMTFSQKVDVFYRMSAMIAHYSDKAITTKLMVRLKKLKEYLLESANKRNRYVHAHWMSVSKRKYALVKVKTKDSGLYMVYRKFQQRDIDRDIRYVHLTVHKLEIYNSATERERSKHFQRVARHSIRMKKSIAKQVTKKESST